MSTPFPIASGNSKTYKYKKGKTTNPNNSFFTKRKKSCSGGI